MGVLISTEVIVSSFMRLGLGVYEKSQCIWFTLFTSYPRDAPAYTTGQLIK